MANPIYDAIKQVCEEKGITVESVVATLEAALAAAFRKDFGQKGQNVKVEFDPMTGASKVFDVKTVVEDISEEELLKMQEEREEGLRGHERAEEGARRQEKAADMPAQAGGEPERKRFNPKTDIMISEAKKIKVDAELGEIIKTELTVPSAYGRMAAQTAKQVIIQKLKEVEREGLYREFQGKAGEILTGIIQRREGMNVLIDLGKITAILPPEEQVDRERYIPGQRLKFLVVSVEATPKGPFIKASRAHADIIRKLFTLEIPEIASGVVEIKAIAREAGGRSKVAVYTKEENIDPIGSCIGQRGTRIQTIIAEIGGEKIDIIEWNEEPAKFIANALSPAKIVRIELNPDEKASLALVNADQLSLAIGRGGQNVRLAAKLTGWKINVQEAKAEAPKEEGLIGQETQPSTSAPTSLKSSEGHSKATADTSPDLPAQAGATAGKEAGKEPSSAKASEGKKKRTRKVLTEEEKKEKEEKKAKKKVKKDEGKTDKKEEPVIV